MTKRKHPEKDLPEVVESLAASFREHKKLNNIGRTTLPSRDAVAQIILHLEELVYPGYFGKQELTWETVEFHLGSQLDEVFKELTQQIFLCIQYTCESATPDATCGHCEHLAAEFAMAFLKELPKLRALLELDLQALYDGDPAAKSLDEIIFSYPGMKAITVYRFAHELHLKQIPLMPRIMSEIAHAETGIDIHPGATIGRAFFIDHGTGVVIGETAVIGNRVRIYQGVTLGAKSFPLDEDGNPIKGIPRHPIVEDDVIVYSGATILGRVTLGRGSVIGGNVWLTRSVPPGSQVTQAAAQQEQFEQGGGI